MKVYVPSFHIRYNKFIEFFSKSSLFVQLYPKVANNLDFADIVTLVTFQLVTFFEPCDSRSAAVLF